MDQDQEYKFLYQVMPTADGNCAEEIRVSLNRPNRDL